MPVQFEQRADKLCVLQISGVLRQEEFATAQHELALTIDRGAAPRLMVVDDGFGGWERGADWNDLDFLLSHSGEIASIAIVAAPRWEVQALAVAAAGVRKAPVKFCSPSELADARAWLSE